MPKITREQLNKWNAQAANGFRLDLEYFLTWGEKRLEKIITRENGDRFSIILEYFPEYEKIPCGQYFTRNRPTGRQIPHISVEYNYLLDKDKAREGAYNFYSFSDILPKQPIAEPETSKKFTTLCKLSQTIDAAEWIEKARARHPGASIYNSTI